MGYKKFAWGSMLWLTIYLLFQIIHSITIQSNCTIMVFSSFSYSHFLLLVQRDSNYTGKSEMSRITGNGLQKNFLVSLLTLTISLLFQITHSITIQSNCTILSFSSFSYSPFLLLVQRDSNYTGKSEMSRITGNEQDNGKWVTKENMKN